MKAFTMYRRNVAAFGRHDEKQMNPPDEPQFEGVVFSDGKVALRWLTAAGSTSVWDSLDEMLAIHGHPEYDSQLVWHDLTPQPIMNEGEALHWKDRALSAEDMVERLKNDQGREQ